MGQAKSRGTREERIQQAQEQQIVRQPTSIDDIRKELNIPTEAKFCGCIVTIKGTDDFLAAIEDKGTGVNPTYCPTPAYALRYGTREDANTVAASLARPAVSALLFEHQGQWFVALDE